MSIKTQHLTLA